jgi:hypothetical protein
MVHPQVAVGGDGLRIWRVAENVLNNQLLIASNGRSPSLRVGCGANNSAQYKVLHRATDLDRLFGTA